MLAIKLMRTGAKKSPSYRVVVKEKQSKRDGAYLENLGTYNPTRNPAEIKLNLTRVNYWIEKGAQPTDTVNRLIKASAKAEKAAEATGLVSELAMRDVIEMIVKALVDDSDTVIFAKSSSAMGPLSSKCASRRTTSARSSASRVKRYAR